MKGIGGWYRVGKTIDSAPPPRPHGLDQAPIGHHHFDIEAFYSDHEMGEWEELQLFPLYAEAALSDLSRGQCEHLDSCELKPIPGQGSYDFSIMTVEKLAEEAAAAATPAWIQKLYHLGAALTPVGTVGGVGIVLYWILRISSWGGRSAWIRVRRIIRPRSPNMSDARIQYLADAQNPEAQICIDNRG